jgi:NADH-quinone oxidoreductase subunit M
VNYGDVTNPKNEKLPDLSMREWAALAPAVILAIVMGVLPQIFLTPMESPVEGIIKQVTRQPASVRQVTPPPVPAPHVRLASDTRDRLAEPEAH